MEIGGGQALPIFVDEKNAKKPELKTKVVFADFYRDSPLVKIVASTEFLLLFKCGEDDVKVKQTMDWNGKGADLALLVTDLRPRGGTGWSIRPHSAPVLRACSVFLVDGEHPRRTWWYKLLCNPVALHPGSRFRFSFRRESDEKSFTMMLWTVEEKASISAGKSLLLNLPMEILQMVVDRVDGGTAVDTVPFVSQTLFALTKRKKNWQELPFRKPIGGSRNGLAVCSIARRSCEALTVGMNLENERFYRNALVGYVWPKLKTLCVADKFRDRSSSYSNSLGEGMRSGNFPIVERLILTGAPKTGYSPEWSSLNGCPLPTLRELSLELTFFLGSDAQETAVSGLFRQYPLLEKLAVRVADAPLQFRNSLLAPALIQGLVAGHLPNLKRLEFVVGFEYEEGERSNDNVDNNDDGGDEEEEEEEEIEEDNTPFVHKGVETLILGLDGSDFGDTFGFDVTFEGDWLFSRFPNIKTLIVGACVKLDWTSAPDGALANVKRIKMSMEDGAPETPVPFEKMLNLEEAWVTLPDEDKMPDRVSPLSGLFELAALPSNNCKIKFFPLYACFSAFDDGSEARECDFGGTRLPIA